MGDYEYLVVYDYGMGGVWAVVTAPSKAAIEEAYPDLVVVDERPDWIDDEEHRRLKARSGFHFDEPDEYWTRFYRPT